MTKKQNVVRKKVAPFDKVDLNSETTHHFAEHEILLSFNGDDGAEAFYEWWNAKNGGASKFAEWCRDECPEALR